ncbi:hypothetical protein PC129_g3183 [Phytophthora cactorum]|uniref:Uncharacterized protein n=1 Tax=Phytophthora cactorum TaxID=29920 RepID=A0A329RDU7_9STRA|nr:hypothetical protein PC113_g5030 [Phytophthora cactorum]KAG2921792.1 hypothetical protein PC114_g5539 [Phytophthora cactorum]KAG2937245.1 hypothetical protein PC115_g4305 [Phytophthora cactorum]KAG2952384.1 hypothetical protein PC117_g2864 [Phytophthora cactorum]KAG3226210.1 hypothetical protein PC129_g3183 [Phytophthora cactorum]
MWFVVVKSDQDKTSVPLGLVTMYKYDLATTELNSMVLSSAELTKAKTTLFTFKARYPVWDVIHVLKDPVQIKKMTYTHICTAGDESKHWKKCLCTCGNSSDAKTHMLGRDEHNIAVGERGKREKRVRTYLTGDEEEREHLRSENRIVVYQAISAQR